MKQCLFSELSKQFPEDIYKSIIFEDVERIGVGSLADVPTFEGLKRPISAGAFIVVDGFKTPKGEYFLKRSYEPSHKKEESSPVCVVVKQGRSLYYLPYPSGSPLHTLSVHDKDMVIYKDGVFYDLPITGNEGHSLGEINVSGLTEIDIHDLNSLTEASPENELVDVRGLKDIDARDTDLIIKQNARFVSLPYPKGLSLDNIDIVGYIGETERKIVVFGTKNAGCFFIPAEKPIYDSKLKLSNKIEDTATEAK